MVLHNVIMEEFIKQAAPIFSAALLAFMFSLVIFYVTERLKRKTERKEMLRNVYREIRFNLNFLDKYKIELDRLVQKVIANDQNVSHFFKFGKLQRTFLLNAFDKGLLYEVLTDEEINTIDSMIGFFFKDTDNFLASKLSEFKDSEVTTSDMLHRLQWNIDELIRYRDFIALIQSRFPIK